MQHFSTRIPWKDNGFTGRIDNNPKYNVAAQAIPNIASTRDLEFEERNKGKKYNDVEITEVKNWITENAAFMSNEKLHIKMMHPYKNNEKFTHFEETKFTVEPYSFLLRPFSWTLKENAIKKQRCYNFYFDLEKTEQMLSWRSSWVSHGESQKGIFDYFYSGIVPGNSLVFPYYKQVPFIEDNRRVIAGIGNISSKVQLQEYESNGSSIEKNYIWETNTAHTIRENGNNGFLMPYGEIYEYSRNHPEFDIASVVIFEPTGFRDEFSYAAEWVSYDAAIDVLNQAKNVLTNIATLNLKEANFEWANMQLEYVHNQLKQVWIQRGVFPGLGSVLTAFGVSYGFDVAKYIDTSENDLISELKLFFSGDKEIGDEKLDAGLAEKENEFLGLLQHDDKIGFFEILARLNLSIEQAEFAWNKREEYAEKIIANPYLLYELTRKEKPEFQIAISQIDNGMFVNPLIKNMHPVTGLAKMRSEGDKRRFRAMVIFVLMQAAQSGHTLLGFDGIIENINTLPLDKRTDFQTEIIDGVLEFLLEGELYVDKGNRYIKLQEYQEYKELIFGVVDGALEKDYANKENWREIIDNQFGELQKGNEKKDEEARKEKATALDVLESSRISILLGRAGTGKTSALGFFASSEKIRNGGVLALTPTGKSRVQLENSFRDNQVKAEVMTVAQFLIRSKGFSWDTMTYQIPTLRSTSVAKTIIIDECSMLTEEMFAGILKLVDAHAERIVFTGDPNQLPPIGAGRPFVDLVNYLKVKHPEKIATLKTEMRQGSGGDDVLFAQIFADSASLDKDILYRVQNNTLDNRLKYVQYTDTDELEDIFFRELARITKMANREDSIGFNRSLGASIDKYAEYETCDHIEDWQILTPTKFVGLGSYYFNDQIHMQYRQDIVEDWSQNSWSKCKPQSEQNIVFGDKIISNVNGERDYWDGSSGKEYIANGEIGIMAGYPGHYGKKDKNYKWYKVRFSSFEGKIFSYSKSDFGGESSDSKLELAYALTVHKSQGSSFGKTIVVINGKNSFITKELLYTAFSRQKDELTILSDLPIEELYQYSNDWYSDIKQRHTDLFDRPNIVEIEQKGQRRFLEEKLIHKTLRGEMVRSKSEVIVANILDAMGIDYSYEEPLIVKDRMYIPDFTLRHQGKVAYLEHLGMLGIASYKRKWQEKRSDYESIGISEALGNLIITEDGLDQSIDAILIENRIKAWIEMR